MFTLGTVKVRAPAAPVPLSAIVWCGLPGALSFSVTVPLFDPAAVGEKLTVIVQLCWMARVFGGIGQLLLSLKFPLCVMLLKLTE